MDLREAEEAMKRFSRLIDEAIDDYEQRAENHAAAKRDYRKAKAKAWLEAPEGTAKAREAWVDGECADRGFDKDVAFGLLLSAWGALESRRGQLNAIQSLLASYREEAKFARTGPEFRP